MPNTLNLKKLTFLVYGLGTTGQSVVKYFKKKKFLNYYTWDDNNQLKKNFESSNATNLKKIF